MRPRVFISSTIRDFEDLRSAVRFWLDERGMNVQMSEYADFEITPELHVLETCFDIIEKSDYFILLIGNRRGGWFDLTRRVSITQREYQVACESFAATGKPVCIPFVRKSTQMLVDNIALVRGGEEKQQALVQDLLEDPEHLMCFLTEVSKMSGRQEVYEARDRSCRGNWISRFGDFEDIATTLTRAMKLDVDIDTQSLLFMIADELLDYLKTHSNRSTGTPCFTFQYLSPLKQKYPLTFDNTRAGATIEMDYGDLKYFFYCVYGGVLLFAQPLIALERGCVTSMLMNYDAKSKRFTPAPMQVALRRTQAMINWVRTRGMDSDYYDAMKEVGVLETRHKGAAKVRVPGHAVATLFAIGGHIERSVYEAMNIIGNVLYGTSLSDNPSAHVPMSPISESSVNTKQEQCTREDIQVLLKRALRIGGSR